MYRSSLACFFFFNDTAPTEIYTLSLHDALPICRRGSGGRGPERPGKDRNRAARCRRDRKSTRLNSSHSQISYAVFCLKKKKTRNGHNTPTTLHSCLSTYTDLTSVILGPIKSTCV